MFDVFVTTELNDWVWEADRLAVAGHSDTPTAPSGFRVMVAIANLLFSATLVAVTVTVCGLDIVAGAVYRPALDIGDESVPNAGLNDQVTAVFDVPLTKAVSD